MAILTAVCCVWPFSRYEINRPVDGSKIFGNRILFVATLPLQLAVTTNAVTSLIVICVFELQRFLEKIPVATRKPQGIVERHVGLSWLQQTFVVELFDIEEISKRRKTKHLQKLFCRDISEGRAGLGRAQGPVDEIETFQPPDDVTTISLPARRDSSARVAGCR